jgi:transcriptional regulator
MYIPEHFRVHDHEDAIAFMRANPFVILVSSAATEPFATHLPVVIRDTGPQLVIRGHVAKANPHWRYLQEHPLSLTIFHGPHAFISTTNYGTQEAVPTWNFGAVHAYGNARVFSAPDELLSVLHELIPLFQPAYAGQWAGLSESYHDRMLGHIVGFEIAITRLEAKFKLSQNRTRDEQQQIIDSLSRDSDTAASDTARLMCEQGLGTQARATREVKREK